jgi:hypothetical protein
MGTRSFNLIVILFWLATMSWLVAAKVLPPLRVGEPPNYVSIIEQSQEQAPVCWSIHLQDRKVGWAAIRIIHRADGITDLYSRVYLGELPWDEMAPGWLGAVLKPVFDDLGALDFDKCSRLVIDPLGRPVAFELRVRMGNLPDAIKVLGQIEGSTLALSVQSGELTHKMACYLPTGAVMTDELSPQVLLPGLRVGQSWTVPLYSPFRAPGNPLEVLQAIVEREDKIMWDGHSENSRVVVYRGDSGSGLTGNETRGRIWVRDDGLVLRQEVAILNSRVQFVRLNDDRAKNIWQALGDEWNSRLPPATARRLLRELDDDTP